MELFKNTFTYCASKGNYAHSPRKEWMTKGLAKSCYKKSKLYRKALTNPTVENKKRYTDYKNKLKTILKKAEKSYYEVKFNSCNGDLKSTWKILSNLTKTKNANAGIPQKCRNSDISFLDQGVSITQPKNISDKFNQFFVSVGRNLANKIPTPPPIPFNSYLCGSYPDSFALLPTTPTEILDITNSLNNKHSFGHDEIPVSILKQTILPIATVLSALVNYSFTSGTFPKELKIAKVCPIYKSGPQDSFSNYRPISILPSFSKIFEKAMYVRLEKYVLTKNILIANQYGFRTHHSPYMALLDFYDKISKSIENNLVSIGVFIDLQKAFDSLDHSILKNKLKHYGIRGIVFDWFDSYLTSREQYLCFNNVESDLELVTFGVPQGSILGPILFTLYINDIINSSSLLYPILFADDTNLLISGTNYDDVITVLNPELNQLSQWFQSNKLSLNVAKTNFMLFGSKRKRILSVKPIMINGKIIERVSETKFLGIVIDEGLNWKNHADYIATKISKNIGVLNRVKHILNRGTLKILYSTMIQPYLLYCVLLWGNASLLALDKIEKLQKRAIRLVSGSSYLAHTSPLFTRLSLLQLRDIYKKEVVIFMYKCLNNLLPVCCASYVKRAVPKCYALRTEDDFEQEFARTLIRQNFISHIGPSIWKVIPSYVRSAVSISILKTNFVQFAINNY